MSLETITLEANALFAGRRSPGRDRHAALSFDADADLATLTATFGVADKLLDLQAERSSESPGWVDGMRGFAGWLVDNGTSPELKRKRTGLFFVGDLANELASAAQACGLSAAQCHEWLQSDALKTVERAPALSLYREALHDKAANGQAAWEDNDLTDLFYLTCAAGYVDHVVGDRRTVVVLRQGSHRLKRGLKIHRNLRELVAALGASQSFTYLKRMCSNPGSNSSS